MRTDLPPAALRLMATCVVHTHERKQPERLAGYNPNPHKQRGSTIFGKAGKAFSLGKKRD